MLVHMKYHIFSLYRSMYLVRGTTPGAYAITCPFFLLLSRKIYKLITQIGIRKFGKGAGSVGVFGAT